MRAGRGQASSLTHASTLGEPWNTQGAPNARRRVSNSGGVLKTVVRVGSRMFGDVHSVNIPYDQDNLLGSAI
jgi:hypothetical protein